MKITGADAEFTPCDTNFLMLKATIQIPAQ